VVTQVLPSEEEALLSPAEQVVGTMDTIKIRAYTPYDTPALWACLTSEGTECVMPGPAQTKVEAVIENNNTLLTIYPGTLPVGR